MFLGEWESTMLLPQPWPLPDIQTPVVGERAPPIQVMPPTLKVSDTTYSWDYATVHTIKNKTTFKGGEVIIEGTFQNHGTGHTVQTQFGEFTNALKLSHEYVENREGLPWAKQKGITRAAGEQYFVEGLGLVYEKMEHQVDSDGTGVLLERSIKTFSQLTPATP
jgi:hypothetical protein